VEKAVLLAGNVQGVTEVKKDGCRRRRPGKKSSITVIKPGRLVVRDRQAILWKGQRLSEDLRGEPGVIKDANLIYPGQKIRIPLE